ncbi:MAG TPA: hypothetical protein VIN71_08470, partial [Pseudomonadales bacterium]
MRLLYLPMLRCYCLWLALLLPAAGHAFSLTGISDASVMENTAYNSPMPAVSGTISGAISYALISDGLNPLDNLDYLKVLPVFSGMNNFQIVLWLVFNDDSSLFSADAMTGVVSMPARWADPALDKNGDNIHNVILVATDGDGNKAALHWQVTLQEEPPLSFAIAGISNSTVYENTAWVSPQPVITDRYLGSISYSLAGNDAALFTVNSSTGVVSLPARDFENPQDQNLDNRYDVTLLATDSKNNQASLAFSVTVLDLPSLNFTLQARHDQVDEGQTYQSPPPSTSGAFRPPLTYYLEGPDSALFAINSSSGRLTLAAQRYANPSDADGDNIYRLTLWAVDSDNNSASVDWTVTVRFVLLKDSDGDGVLDPFEIADGSDPGNPLSFRDRNANGIADAQENDADSDGIDNTSESGGIDPYGDHNNDGVPNVLDPLDRGDGQPASCTLVTINNFPDATDGSPTSRDICDIHSGLDPLFDQDQDGVPNFRDSDSDGDLIPDIIEAGTDINGVPRDTDGDGVADFLDIDSDGDGIPDIVENMPYSVDSNNNGIADVFDAAIHGFDISPAFQGELVAQLLAEVRISEALASGQWLADHDNDGVPNYRDIDSDGDGIPDALEGSLGRDTLGNGIDDSYDVLV